MSLTIHDLGSMAYAESFALQKKLQREVIEQRETGGRTQHLLLVEHDPPVITVSRRRGAAAHLVATDEQLRAAGIEVAETDRGGDITYHGPGQLVVYPILDLNVHGLRLHGYMRLLEQIIIDALVTWGVEGRRDPDATGVWVGEGTGRKICAMGVRVARWVTMHGLALNVAPTLAHFDMIVPCGLAGRSVTSLEAELGEAAPTMPAVKQIIVERFEAVVA